MSAVRPHRESSRRPYAGTTYVEKSPGKILIIRLGSLGDVILTTPLLSSLCASWPAAKIDIAVKREYAGLFDDDPRVNSVRVFDSRGTHKGLVGLFKYISGLRAAGYDLILDLHRNLRSFAMRKWLPRSRSVVYHKGVLQRRFLVWWGPSAKDGREPRHTVHKYLDVLKPLGFPPTFFLPPHGDGGEGGRIGIPQPSIHLSQENTRWAEEYHRSIARGKTIIGIAPSAAWATKKWPGDRFTAVAQRAARDLSVTTVFFGGPEDRPFLQDIAGDPVSVLTGDVGLKNLAAVIQRCGLFLTNDSGLMHLATAVGTPVLAVFGPTTRDLGFFPLGPHDAVVEKDLPCRPCTLHGDERCPQGHFRCMDLITVDEVFDLVRRRVTGNEER